MATHLQEIRCTHAFAAPLAQCTHAGCPHYKETGTALSWAGLNLRAMYHQAEKG